MTWSRAQWLAGDASPSPTQVLAADRSEDRATPPRPPRFGSSEAAPAPGASPSWGATGYRQPSAVPHVGAEQLARLLCLFLLFLSACGRPPWRRLSAAFGVPGLHESRQVAPSGWVGGRGHERLASRPGWRALGVWRLLHAGDRERVWEGKTRRDQIERVGCGAMRGGRPGRGGPDVARGTERTPPWREAARRLLGSETVQTLYRRAGAAACSGVVRPERPSSAAPPGAPDDRLCQVDRVLPPHRSSESTCASTTPIGPIAAWA
jgi:hypothetical protein